MKCVIQRVSGAKVEISCKTVAEIGKGLVVFAAFCENDDRKTVDYCVNKILNLRIFSDGDGKLNLSAHDVGGSVLIVSNFTVYGDTSSSGRRPDFSKSAKSDISRPLYDYFVKRASDFIHVESGVFGADMTVSIVNDGPVTVIVEKENV